jgi:hypothetical protein
MQYPNPIHDVRVNQCRPDRIEPDAHLAEHAVLLLKPLQVALLGHGETLTHACMTIASVEETLVQSSPCICTPPPDWGFAAPHRNPTGNWVRAVDMGSDGRGEGCGRRACGEPRWEERSRGSSAARRENGGEGGGLAGGDGGSRGRLARARI